MDKFKESFDQKTRNNGFHIKSVLLALGLALGITNFSYSQENGGKKFDKTEQVSKFGEKSIETYKIRINNRNKNIEEKTSETLGQFATRLGIQFNSEVKRDGNISHKINEIKDILNNKYSQNIDSNDPSFILQIALKLIGNTNTYTGLEEYTNNLSGSFDINFINAIGYIQYLNNLSDNGNLIGKNGESTLDVIIYTLGQKNSNNETIVILKGEHHTPIQNEPQLSQDKPNHTVPKQYESAKTGPIQDKTLTKKVETNKISIDNKINESNPGYAAKVKNRDANITQKTSESIGDFADRINKQFSKEITDKTSLISKKILNIKDLLENKYSSQMNDTPIAIIQSALIELSKTDKYKGLQEYTDKFSGNFDINFVNAYGFVQYINDWNCNWALCGKDGALILQSIYDDLNNIKETKHNYIREDTEKNHPLESKKDTPVESNNDENKDLNSSTSANSDQNSKVNIRPNNDDESNSKEKPSIEPNDIEMSGITLLSKNLSSEKLNGVTYEDVWNTVNGFKHEGLKNAVMNRLLHNDVIGAQRLLGMDINCNRSRYPDYVASTKIGQRELDLMENLGESRRYMDTQEVLNFMERVEKAYEIENYEVKTAYLKFLSGEYNNEGLPYCIVSKYDYKIYLFSADHKLVACQPVLTGAHIGNNKNDPIHGSHTTPGGMYVMGGAFDKSSEGKNLVSVYGTDYILFLPQEGQYNYSEEYSMGMHGYVKGRERRFSSQNTKDHRVSNGCINIIRKKFGEIINHLKTGSKIYICKDDDM